MRFGSPAWAFRQIRLLTRRANQGHNAIIPKSIGASSLALRARGLDDHAAIQQLGDLGGGRQRLVLGAAIGFGAQRLNAELKLVEHGRIERLIITKGRAPLSRRELKRDR